MNVTGYIYKSFTGGTYNGVLDVISKFNLVQEINTSGSQLEVELGIALQDADPELLTDLLITEDGDFIVTTDLENIIIGTDISIPGIPALNDRIEVWEFTEENPAGRIVFNGFVSKWSSNYKANSTKLTLLSYGVHLDNYLVQILPQESIAEQLTQNSTETIYGEYKTPTYDRIISTSQTFVVPADTDVTGIYLQMYKSGAGTGSGLIAQLEIIEGTPTTPGSVLVTKQVLVTVDTIDLVLFSFGTAVSLLQSETYHIRITSPFGSNLSESSLMVVGHNSAGGYTDGQRYIEQDISGISTPGGDLYFQLLSATGGVGNIFNSYDPSNIVRELLDNYASLGGLVSYTEDSIEDTLTTVSYTFKFTTYLEALKKSVELAPQNWWWFVDPSNGIVYFKPLSQEVDHKFILGKHLSELEIEYSLEDVVNTVYFSGGDTGGGVNLVTNQSNEESVAQYGTWLKTPSDNRVTDESTADIISESLINQFKDPRFKTSITIPAYKYDIGTINIGEIVGFGNFNSLIDSLQLQIMRADYSGDAVTLDLDILPPSQSKRIEDIKRNLDKEQTRDNPVA